MPGVHRNSIELYRNACSSAEFSFRCGHLVGCFLKKKRKENELANAKLVCRSCAKATKLDFIWCWIIVWLTTARTATQSLIRCASANSCRLDLKARFGGSICSSIWVVLFAELAWKVWFARQVSSRSDPVHHPSAILICDSYLRFFAAILIWSFFTARPVNPVADTRSLAVCSSDQIHLSNRSDQSTHRVDPSIAGGQCACHFESAVSQLCDLIL